MQKIIRSIYKRILQITCIRRNVTYPKDLKVGRGSIIFSRDGLTIGEKVKIGINCSIIVNGHIGDGTRISSYVAIVGKNDHEYGVVGQRPFDAKWIFDEDFPPRDDRHSINIGKDVLIGWGAIIFSGIKIGQGAWIGAGSVVTSDVEPYTKVAGVPAKKIGVMFNDEEIKAHFIKVKEKYNEDISIDY